MTVKEYYNNTKKSSKNMNYKLIENEILENIGSNKYIYGCDVQGSLMSSSVGSWNFGNLSTLLKTGLGDYKLPGINEPYIYFGDYGTMFAWHVEDLNLPSMNYLHYGSPKVWYFVPGSQYKLLVNYFKSIYLENYVNCTEYHRHKNIIINPYYLKEQIPGLQIQRLEQHPGDIIITFSKSFHFGMNLGFNIAEAVNFGYYYWLTELYQPKICKCLKDFAIINIFEFYNNIKYTKNIDKNNSYFKKFEEKIKKMENKIRKNKIMRNRSFN